MLSLPFIKREGLKAQPPNSGLAQAITMVEAIKKFYRTSCPKVYGGERRGNR